jgi:hypothetical protein
MFNAPGRRIADELVGTPQSFSPRNTMTDFDTLPEQDVVAADWDYLIVLDAARYDTFARVYDDYVDGELQKLRSKGSATPEWAAKTFTGDHDLTYLSANPFINSLGIPLNELKWGASAGYDWTASDHIAEIVDLWQEEWDDDLGAVTPETVTDAALERVSEGYEGRLVVHFLQPHAPYLKEGEGRKLRRIKAGFEDVPDEAERHPVRRSVASMADRLRTRIEPVLGNSELAMRLGMLLELNASSVFDFLDGGIEASLRRYYEENLRLALEEAARLVDHLDGSVVITSDHGEAFGEQGVWEHHIETYIPPLIEVPWLRVE